jgi:heme exporter protein B
MTLVRDAWLVVRNEIRLELRTKEIFYTTTLFALLMAVISSLAFYLDRISALNIAPGVLWLALAFSGIVAMSRSWLREREWLVIDALLLCPISRTALFAGKSISVLLLMIVNSVFLTFFVAILCHISPFLSQNIARNLGFLSLFLMTGLVGFVTAGTLFASMSVRAKTRELTLSLILFPLCAPALLAAVVATRELFAGAPNAELWDWVRLLLAFDLIMIAVCPLLFERLFSNA